MIKFKKYNSIENHYRSREILHWLTIFPELKDEEFVLTEKIHGANIQVIFNPDQPIMVGKRSGIIGKGLRKELYMDFYNMGEVIEKNIEVIELIQNHVDKHNTPLKFYGELYGGGVQKGVDYGKEVKFIFYDMSIENDLKDEEIVDQETFFNTLDTIGIDKKYIIPVLDNVSTLNSVINYPESFNSKILNKLDNEAEGFVAKPFNKVYLMGQGIIFYIKKKSEKFKEESRAKKTPTFIPATEIQKLHDEFLTYITKNRMEGIFSKEGEIKENKQIGVFIGLLIQDAIKDFEKDFPKVAEYDKKEKKYIYKIGNKGFQLIKKYL